MMARQLKLLTLSDCDLSNLEDIKLIGITELSVFSDEVLYEIIKRFDEEGKKEIIRMLDRGQVSQRQVERVLGENEYERVGRLVPCEW